MKQEDKTLKWLNEELKNIDRDIMHYVHLIKDMRYEKGAVTRLKELSSKKTAFLDAIAAVKYMYNKLNNEEETNNIIQTTYKKKGKWYCGISKKKYKIKGE